jgi:5-(carboxyamino)imidazole ribonucleotide synthase
MKQQTPLPIMPGATIGMLGGGQLGRMFCLAASQLGYHVVAYTPEKDSPISDVCRQTIVASYEDESRLLDFANQVDVVTIEFENIPAPALEFLSQHVPVRPHPHVLFVTQNRLREKTFLAEHGFPVVPHAHVTTPASLKSAIGKLGTPAVLKTAGFGYDGKGQRRIEDGADVDAIIKDLDGQDAILEAFVQFDKEISVIGARGISGDFVAYGPMENYHKNHILDISFAPARLSWTLSEEAIDITRSIMEALDVVGLLCVEFFLTVQETLLVNELAPRPHNSGHLTIESCPTNQFEQHVRAITGLPLGSTETEKGVAMANLLGDLWQEGEPDWASAVALPEVHLHLYGKGDARPGRKMGHLTACARWADEAVLLVKSARDSLSRVKA